MKKSHSKNILILTTLLPLLFATGCQKNTHKTVKVGLLHSLTGAMAISEVPLRDAELLAIEEINEKGGVLGRKIVPVEKDGKSNPTKFAENARKLITEDKVATVFGCWTSNSRKAVKPIFEEYYNLLWYPLQYEGMEASPNIMYIGASPNQQIVPAIEWCTANVGKKLYLIGSDYLYPRTAHKIIKKQMAVCNGTIVGEDYVPMNQTDFSSIIKDIKAAKPDIIINTLNGNSNISFFKQLKNAGISSANTPVMSFSISESDVPYIGIENLSGHYTSWNYYETVDTFRNKEFVYNYKEKFGQDKNIGDPVEAAYVSVYLWAAACEKAGTFEIEPVRIAAKGLSYDAPEGLVTIEGSNQHLNKTIRIGTFSNEGKIVEVWSTPSTVRPDPYLSTYSWAKGL